MNAAYFIQGLPNVELKQDDSYEFNIKKKSILVGLFYMILCKTITYY